jgi:hypothetical protein
MTLHLNPALAGRFAHSWTLDEVEDYLDTGKRLQAPGHSKAVRRG